MRKFFGAIAGLSAYVALASPGGEKKPMPETVANPPIVKPQTSNDEVSVTSKSQRAIQNVERFGAASYETQKATGATAPSHVVMIWSASWWKWWMFPIRPRTVVG